VISRFQAFAFECSLCRYTKVREMVLAEVAAEDDGERPDFSAWAPSRDAMPPLKTGDLTEEQKEYVTWHAARREANMRAKVGGGGCAQVVKSVVTHGA
jgi:hypothetical protein